MRVTRKYENGNQLSGNLTRIRVESLSPGDRYFDSELFVNFPNEAKTFSSVAENGFKSKE
jgi:hypothetical protein